jgi:hypothetical protein
LASGGRAFAHSAAAHMRLPDLRKTATHADLLFGASHVLPAAIFWETVKS